MPTVNVTFGFTSDAQSFTSSAGSAASTLSWDGTVGNPAGSLKTVLAGSAKSDNNSWSRTLTYEAMGVPAGATVTAITAASLDSRCTAFASGTGCTSGAATLVDGSTTVTLSAQRSFSATDAGVVNTAGTNATGLSKASNNSVTLTIPNHLGTTSGGTGKGVTLLHDNLNFTITYDNPPPPAPPPAPVLTVARGAALAIALLAGVPPDAPAGRVFTEGSGGRSGYLHTRARSGWQQAATAALASAPLDAPPVAAPPIDASTPDRVPAASRAAAQAYWALASPTPRDAGDLSFEGWQPDVAPGPRRTAHDAYRGLISPSPRDAGTRPILGAMPERAPPASRAAPTEYRGLLSPAPRDAGDVGFRGWQPDVASGPRRAATSAYRGLISACPPTAWTLVQTTQAQSTAASSLDTPSITVAAGDLVFVVVDADQPGNTLSLSDSAGNAWTRYSSHDNGVSLVAAAFYSVITRPGPTVLTGSLASGSGFLTLIAGEWHQTLGDTIVPDGIAQAHGSGTTPSSGSITTTGSSDLLASVLDFGGVTSFTPASGWTTEATAAAGGTIPAVLADRLDAPAGTYSGDWTAGGAATWIATVAAFRVEMAPPIAASAPSRADAPRRATTTAYAVLLGPATPRDAGIVLAPPPIAPATPDRAPAPRRSAATAYRGLLSPTPRDAGTLPTPVILPDRAPGAPRAASVAYAALLGPATPRDAGTSPLPVQAPQRAPTASRAATVAYVALLGPATPRDSGVLVVTAPVAPATPGPQAPRRTAAIEYRGLLSPTPRDAGLAPIPAATPDRAIRALRAAATGYRGLIAATPRDAGTPSPGAVRLMLTQMRAI